MFLRCNTRKKDGKVHRYYSVVENRRVANGRVVQKPVLYLGEITDDQQKAWRKSLKVFGFGSQSDAGAKTREVLMTVLHTLKKRTTDVTPAFKSALDELAEDGDINPYKAVFSFDSS